MSISPEQCDCCSAKGRHSLSADSFELTTEFLSKIDASDATNLSTVKIFINLSEPKLNKKTSFYMFWPMVDICKGVG